MEDEDFSWKERKNPMRDNLGKIVPIPPNTPDNAIKEIASHLEEDAEADIVIDAVKRRLTMILSEELHEK